MTSLPMLRPVRREDVRPLLAMQVSPDQAHYVAPNSVTLSQAPYETGAHVFGIWNDVTLVGLLAMVDNRDYKYAEPGDDPNSAYMWRLLIDRKHQRCGYGRAAIMEMCQWVRARGLPRIFTSVVIGNSAAASLYASLGFIDTGRVIDGEDEMCLQLPDP